MIMNSFWMLEGIATTRQRTVVMSVHQPSFKILSFVDRIVVLAKGGVVHHGTMGSLGDWMGQNGFTVPPQLNALEYAMEILGDLQDVKSKVVVEEATDEVEKAAGGSDEAVVSYQSSRLREIGILFSRSWKIIYRTKQLLLTNVLEALGVGLVLGTIYINIGYDRQGIQKRLGLFAFTLTFLLSSTTESLPIFINERPILLRETTSGVYRLSSYLIANTLVFLPYLLVIALIYSASVYFLVGLCATWQAFVYFVLVIWAIVLMANSFVLFLSSLAPNYIAGTSLVTVLLGAFFLFSGYFISKDSMPSYWIFMHFFSMYKYALDALLINEYSCLAWRCLIRYPGNNGCMVTGRDVMVKRGLHEGLRWFNVYVLIGFFVMYRVLCFLVLLRRISRSKK
ncbi:ABC transporter G family member 8-like protein [Drosera capensis]